MSRETQVRFYESRRVRLPPATRPNVLNIDRIRDRLTWTPRDSINSLENAGSDFLTARGIWVRLGILIRNAFIDFPGAVLEPLLGLPTAPRPRRLRRRHRELMKSQLKRTDTRTFLNYVEAQLWDPITLEDVSKLEFTGRSPSSGFAQEIRARGITILDCRAKPCVEWPQVE